MAETVTDRSDFPLLFFKVGSYGSVPMEFPEYLAQRLGISFMSSDVLRATIEQERKSRDITSPIKTQSVQSRFVADAIAHLTQTRGNLVADLSFNSAKKRRYFPVYVAESAQALTVALDVDVSLAKVRYRVEQWQKHGILSSRLLERGVDPMHEAIRNYHEVTHVSDDEPIDYVLHLDGGLNASGLVAQVEEQLTALNLDIARPTV